METLHHAKVYLMRDLKRNWDAVRLIALIQQNENGQQQHFVQLLWQTVSHD